jgi:polyhydroxyalkanoate depolymerase
MLYRTYQLQDDLIAPMRSFARLALPFVQTPTWGLPPISAAMTALMRQHVSASLEMVSRMELGHDRPEFGITSTTVEGEEVPVAEKVLLDLPFCRIVHFAKPVEVEQPRVLVVAPLSGHFATLLRGTVETLIGGHDVYVTDWLNARDVPAEAGSFGVDDYITYLIDALETIGPGAHLLAVCQPCVQALAAVAVMSEAENPATPLSMTLMAGPIDARVNPTEVNELANSRPLEWFEQNVIHTVPNRFAGAGRRVYPGFLQLTAFVSMNPSRHIDQHAAMYRHLVAGEADHAEAIKDFYDEYFAVLDMTDDFYLGTVDRVFQRAELATGEFSYQGRHVDPGAIRKTALLTVEGERDDICSIGQTSAAHELCSSLRPHLKRHHLQPNVGHYGVFSGRRWRNEVYPVVDNLILSVD